MSVFFYIYTGSWASACLIAVASYLRYRSSFAVTCHGYWQFLLKPWKVVTFLTAATGLTVIAPYTGDPTWDYMHSKWNHSEKQWV